MSVGQETDYFDKQYNLRARHPDHPAFFERYRSESARVRGALGGRLDVPYGPSPDEALDIFPASSAKAPVHVFIHGGYWRSLDKRDFSYVAEPFVAAGAAVVVVNYALAPRVTLDEIVRQNCAALAWIYRNAGSFGGDPDRLFVSGHSAGGHLTAMMLVTDWRALGLPADLVKGGCAISGVFDLDPMLATSINADVRLDRAGAARNSPIRHMPDRASPMIAAVGANETDEFVRQSREFAAAWQARGLPGEYLALPGLHHFDIILELGKADAPLTRTMLVLMTG